MEVAVDQGVARKDMLKWDEVDDKQEKSKHLGFNLFLNSMWKGTGISVIN